MAPPGGLTWRLLGLILQKKRVAALVARVPLPLLLQGTSSNAEATGFLFAGPLSPSPGRQGSCCRDMLAHGSWQRGGVRPGGKRRWRVSQEHRERAFMWALGVALPNLITAEISAG